MRSRRLFGLAATLKRVAHARGVAVIVTNQVSDVWEEAAAAAGASGLSGASWASTMPYAWGGGAPCIGRTSAPAHPGSCSLRSNGRACQPALGAAWAQCVGSRILLAYDRGAVPAPAAAPGFAALARVPPPPPPGAPAVSLTALSADSSGGGSGGSSNSNRVPAAGGVRSAWLLRSPCAPRRAVQFELWPGGARGVGALLDLPVG